MNLSQIQKRIEAIEELQRNLRESREMLKEELENNPEYRDAAEQVKELASKKKRLKDEISNTGSNKQLLEKIKEDNEELGVLKEILSAELMQIYTEKNIDEIADRNGETRKFKVMATLLNKKTYDSNQV